MHKLVKNLTGRTFGQWVVLEFVGSRTKSHASYWKCKCSCGKIKEVSGRALCQGKSKKCRDCAGGRPGAPQRKAFGMYQRNAKSRKLSFNLTFEQFLYFSKQNCFYCGDSPSNLQTSPTGEVFYYNGIDRKDNNLGYLFENCVPCCHNCNWAKGAQCQEDFINRCKRISKRFD